MNSLNSWFKTLPQPMRDRLAVGSVGKLHILDTAASGLTNAPPPALATTCADMVLAGFGETPLNGELANQILNTPIIAPLLDSKSRELLRRVKRAWKRPENMAYFKRVVQRRDMGKVKHFLESRIAQEPENLFWYEQVMSVGMYEADYDWLQNCLNSKTLKDLGPVHAALMGQVAMARNEYAKAEKCTLAAGTLFGAGWSSLNQAQAHLKAGDREAGLKLLLETLLESPWQTQAALRAFELLEGHDTGEAKLPGSVAILLYSWNKAEDLDDTLAALHASDLGHAKIFALDNGSTDQTAQVLSTWQDKFGNDRLEVINLPVNIGAAAARNWLMHLPQVRSSDWAIYLDDDALVPPNWLHLLGSAVKRYPDAGVWGCRVVDAAQPALLQAVDYQLVTLDETPTSMDLTRLNPHSVTLSNLHIQVLDNGQFDYVRPCTSVTGCCHLFCTKHLLQTGDFSLFLSPSQYDDLERDLRMAANGQFAVYQGHLRVLHRKRTGRAALEETPQEANALGNKYKMLVMHEPEEIATSTRCGLDILRQDMSTKLTRIDQELAEKS